MPTEEPADMSGVVQLLELDCFPMMCGLPHECEYKRYHRDLIATKVLETRRETDSTSSFKVLIKGAKA